MVQSMTKQARYERKRQIREKVAAQMQAELFAATVAAFPELVFQMQPVTDVDRAIGITIGVSDDAILPKLEKWAYIHSYTLAELLDLIGAEAGRRVATARYQDVSVQVDTVGKVVGDAADYD